MTSRAALYAQLSTVYGNFSNHEENDNVFSPLALALEELGDAMDVMWKSFSSEEINQLNQHWAGIT